MYCWSPMIDKGYRGALPSWPLAKRLRPQKYSDFIKDKDSKATPTPVAEAICHICILSYVSMAEFEVDGIVPQALNYIAYNRRRYRPLKIDVEGVESPLFLIAQPDQGHIVEDFIRCIQIEGLEHQKVKNFARTYNSYHPEKGAPAYDGWIDIKAPLLFFASIGLYNNFCRLYGYTE